MNFYIKNTEATEVVDEKIYMNLPEYDEFKKFIHPVNDFQPKLFNLQLIN